MPKLSVVKPLRLPIRLVVVGIVLLTTVLTAALAIGLQYYFSRAMAIDAAVARYQMTASNTAAFIESTDMRAAQITRLLSKYPMLIKTGSDRPQMSDLFAEVMRNTPILYSIYVGFPNGDFYEVVNLDNDPNVRAGVNALPEDRWVINQVTEKNGVRQRELQYYDNYFTLRDTRTEPSNYDVRQRRWFVEAEPDRVSKSAPYMFQYIQVPGQTYAIKFPDSELVLGIDVTLQSFSNYLADQPLSQDGEIYIYQKSGEMLASSRLTKKREALPQVKPLVVSGDDRAYLDSLGVIKVSNEMDWPPIDFTVAGEPEGYAVDTMRLLAEMLGIPIEFINGYRWPELVEKFDAGELQILQPVYASDDNRARGHMTTPVLQLSAALALNASAPSIKYLANLNGKTLAIPEGWSTIPVIRATYPKIQILEVESVRAALEAVRNGEAYAALDSAVILEFTARQFFIDGLRIDTAFDHGEADLSGELHLLVAPEHKQLEQLLSEALAHLKQSHLPLLEEKWFATDGLQDAGDNLSSIPYKPLLLAAENDKGLNTLLEANIKGQRAFIFVGHLGKAETSSDYFAVVVPEHKVLGAALQRVRFSILLTSACLLFLLPAAWLLAAPVVYPVQRLFDKSVSVKERRYGDVKYQPSLVKEVDDLSLSMVDMAGAIQAHEQAQRDLMEAFIELIAEAIDEKSPYTGGHCARVPELALMLAEAAVESNLPAFVDFNFANDDEHREFRIAAWLHDCGKITVPEHIVDKGTKLETIYNRIHEVRMRFEVLWRDAEIDYLKAIAHDPDTNLAQAATLALRRQQLQEDFAFVAATNVGGEYLDDTAKARLKIIGGQSWQRYFDDRIGLSPVEEMRLESEAQALPATESLLSDRPEHIVARIKTDAYYQGLGVNMDIPEHLYNLGEIYNLSISRGTLSPEDRFKINEHMISTIRMLERLPFPKELARVPRYASTHHETMKGSGYPRKLTGDQLSIPERILAVADIYEALTASDRPYKKAKTVSESIDILHKMMLDEHIDKQVFELFLISGVYRRYASEYLPDSQHDEVDITRYISG